LFADPATAPDAAGLTEALRDELTKQFKPAFLGRVSLVPYLPLNQDTLREIVGLQIARITERVERRYGASVTVSDAALDVIRARCAQSPSGARSIETYLSQTVLPDLSTRFLSRMAEGSPIKQVLIQKEGEDSVTCELV